jgi:hypothetical protein
MFVGMIKTPISVSEASKAKKEPTALPVLNGVSRTFAI